MKQIILILSISVILVISGCGEQSPTQPPNNATIYIPPPECMTCGNSNASTASKSSIQVIP